MKISTYHLSFFEYQEIEVPKGANILSVQTQNGQLQMWAEVMDIPEREMITFQIIGTGGPQYDYEPKRKYISTVQMGEYVWHIFQILN